MATMLETSGNYDKLIGKIDTPIRSHVTKQIESFEKKSQLKEIFHMYDSTEFADAFTSETSVNVFAPTGENGRTPKGDFKEGYSVINNYYEFKGGMTLSKTLIEDGKIGTLAKPRMNKLAEDYYRVREEYGAAILTNGISTTMTFKGKVFNISGADTLALFSTAHTSITGKTANQSNLYTGELNYINLGKAETVMQSFKDDNGNKLEINPDTIIIPNTESAKRKVFEMLNADGNPLTADNAGNYHLGRWNVIVWKYLDTPTGVTAGADWFILMDSVYNQTMQCLVWGDRIKMEPDSWVDKETKEYNYDIRARFGARPNNWRGFLLSAPGLSGTSF